jgi:hypothetical protein
MTVLVFLAVMPAGPNGITTRRPLLNNLGHEYIFICNRIIGSYTTFNLQLQKPSIVVCQSSL